MKPFSRLLIAAIGAAAFASCTQNGPLIYTNIQKTQKTNTSTTIPLDITVHDIVNAGTGPIGPYYVAAGKVYNGSTPVNGTTNWESIAVPTSPPSGVTMLCNALTYDSTRPLLFGGFFDGTGSGYFNLYYLAPNTSPTAPWTPIADSTITDNNKFDKQITYVTAINGDVFVAAATMSSGGSYVYEIDVLPAAASPNGPWVQLAASTIQKPVTGIAWVASAGVYLVTSGSNVYTISGSSPIAASAGAWNSIGGNPIPSSPLLATDGSNSAGNNDILQGIFVDATNGYVIIPASNPQVNPPTGNLYYSGTTTISWTRVSQQQNGYNVGFLCVAGPVGTSPFTTYLLGTDSGTGGAFGFYAFQPTNGNTMNRFGGLSYSLYYSAVRRILVDTTGGLVAMGTINNGLWATTPVDPTGGFGSNTWTQE